MEFVLDPASRKSIQQSWIRKNVVEHQDSSILIIKVNYAVHLRAMHGYKCQPDWSYWHSKCIPQSCYNVFM